MRDLTKRIEKLGVLLLAASTLLLASPQASAGMKESFPVSYTTSGSGGTFSGAFGTAHNAADHVQYISYTADVNGLTNNGSGNAALPGAQLSFGTSTGGQGYCVVYYSDTHMLTVAKGISTNSYISANFDSNHHCTGLTVYNGSLFDVARPFSTPQAPSSPLWPLRPAALAVENVATPNPGVTGSMADVRSSADNLQYMYCFVTSNNGNAPSALCIAQTSKGVTRSCATSDPGQIAVISHLNSNSELTFYATPSGTCDVNLTVTGGSPFNAGY